MHNAAAKAIDWSEQSVVPDTVFRHGIKRLLKKRIAQPDTDDCQLLAERKADFIHSMHLGAIEPLPFKASEQHYQVPTEFFLKVLVLGSQDKYSCCYWGNDTVDLDAAETSALQITCEHADLQDGIDILEPGCVRGSLTLWMARHYPNGKHHWRGKAPQPASTGEWHAGLCRTDERA
jgi:cyclopropane-fatty-acyl-phospholipid synthase